MSDERTEDHHLSRELASLHIRRDAGARGGAVPRIAIVGIVLLLLVGGALFFTRAQSRFFPEEVELGAVTLVSPAQQDVTLVATGYVYSRHKATVAPKVTGRLARLYVDEGDKVTEGQLLAELETGEAQAQMAQAKADVATAHAKVERARASLAEEETRFAREQKLLEKGAGTQAAYDDARTRTATLKAELTASEADVVAAQARQQAAQVSLDNTKIRAPFSGTIVRKLSEVGEVIAVGGMNGNGLLTLESLGDLEVQADVAEAQMIKVRVGTPAEILLDAFPDRRFRGEVKEIRQSVDRAKASVTVKVAFKDPSSGVLPDMAAKVNFLSHALGDEALKVAPKLVLPSDAVAERGGRKVVYVLSDGKAVETAVTLGAQVGPQLVEVQSGPSSGAQVVRHPSDKLRDGAAIKEKERT